MDYTIENNLIEGLCSRDNAAYDHLRKTTYCSIAFITTSFEGIGETPEDLYNEGILALIPYLDKHKNKLKCKVSTLLFTICKYMHRNMVKKKHSELKYLSKAQTDESYEERFEEILDQRLKNNIFLECFNKLKEGCKRLMNMVLNGVPASKIAKDMGFTHGSIRNKKKKCLDALMVIVKENPEYKTMMKNNEIAPLKSFRPEFNTTQQQS